MVVADCEQVWNGNEIRERERFMPKIYTVDPDMPDPAGWKLVMTF